MKDDTTGRIIKDDTTKDPLTRFLSIIESLRKPEGGCPWDLKQTFESLKPLVIEEAYEVADAVEAGPTAVREELGDLLSLIGLFSQIASEQSLFSFSSILQGISDKLVRRHPHVFGEIKVSGTDEVLRNWEQIKQLERKGSSESAHKGLLDGIPRSLPALLKSHQIGARCSRVGFDWGTTDGVVEKIKEELTEFLTEAAQPAATTDGSTPRAMELRGQRALEEFGDLLFTLAQYGRHMGFNAEEALSRANDKFCKRFKELERLAVIQHSSKPLAELTPTELEALWQQAKGDTPT
ncbi:MAG: nucleoside triphosphate pyrophosphohydrolase [Pseudomonadota bacterium]|jgi:ATP diphosphatase